MPRCLTFFKPFVKKKYPKIRRLEIRNYGLSVTCVR